MLGDFHDYGYDKKSDDYDLEEMYLRSEKVSLSRLSSLGLAGWRSPSRLPRPDHEDDGDDLDKEDVNMNDSG